MATEKKRRGRQPNVEKTEEQKAIQAALEEEAKGEVQDWLESSKILTSKDDDIAAFIENIKYDAETLRNQYNLRPITPLFLLLMETYLSGDKVDTSEEDRKTRLTVLTNQITNTKRLIAGIEKDTQENPEDFNLWKEYGMKQRELRLLSDEKTKLESVRKTDGRNKSPRERLITDLKKAYVAAKKKEPTK